MSTRLSTRTAEPPTLVRAARVETLTERSPACAFLYENGVVQQVFTSNEQAQQVAQRPGVRTIDRPGLCIVPGFCDAHVHLKWLGESLREPDLSNCTSYSDVRRRLITFIERHSPNPGTLIRGRGWKPDALTEHGWPHWSDLKHDVLDRYRIALMSHDHHACWINKRMLDQLSMDTTLADREPVICDGDGSPTGVFLETAMEPVIDRIDESRKEQDTNELLADALSELVANGIVCAHDIGHGDSLRAHRTLRTDRDVLPDILFFCFQDSWATLTERQSKPGPLADGLELAGMKLFADGTLGSGTAAMHEPYEDRDPDRPSPRGELINDQQELTAHAKRAASQGFATAIHAIGDRAVQTSLNTLSEVYSGKADLDYRPRIEHAQFISPPDLKRFAQEEIVASVQPCHLYQDAKTAPSRVGDRANRMIPLNALQESDATILFGSDAPIESPDPLRNLQAAVDRSSLPGPISCDESISIEQALSYCCQPPARYLNHSGNRGKIQSGFPASFVTLSDHPSNYSGPLTDIRLMETYIHGSRVYSTDSL